MPQSVGPYRILRELGRGSYGVVYLAQREGEELQCALKVLLAGVGDPKVAARFRLESNLAMRLTHPGILRVYDVGRHGRYPYYAME